MGSPVRGITDIKNIQNLIKTDKLVAALTVDGIPAYINEVEVHGTWQSTGLSSYDAVSGTSQYPGQRLRLGFNVTSFAVKDTGSANGVVFTLEVNRVSPSWKADLKQAVVSAKSRIDLLEANFNVMTAKLEESFQSENVGSIIDAIQGWVDGNATFIPD